MRTCVCAPLMLSVLLVCGCRDKREAGPDRAPPPKPKVDYKSTFIGAPAPETSSQLELQKGMAGGGGSETKTPPAGEIFLIVKFPDARNLVEKLDYVSTDFTLQLAGDKARGPYAVTLNDMSREKLVYREEIWMTPIVFDYEGDFAVVFLVPAVAAGGTLKVKDIENDLVW
jgi:hypothetical protein